MKTPSKKVAQSALLVLITITHYGYGLLAMLISTPARWFYILRGIEGVVLYGVLPFARFDRISLRLCIWGVIESALTSGCGIARLTGSIPTLRPVGEGICDAYGIHTYWLGLAIAAVFALIIWRSHG